jgi:cytochrome c oxidase subunit 2
VGGRKYIAAGLLENTRGSLAAWIADPQTLKPGNNMPMVPLNAEELRSISAYLAGLK